VAKLLAVSVLRDQAVSNFMADNMDAVQRRLLSSSPQVIRKDLLDTLRKACVILGASEQLNIVYDDMMAELDELCSLNHFNEQNEN
jgi:hypothetical protein